MYIQIYVHDTTINWIFMLKNNSTYLNKDDLFVHRYLYYDSVVFHGDYGKPMDEILSYVV